MQLAAGHSWRPDAGLGRWGGALATILVLHASAALGSMIVWETTDPPTPPPAAIMLDLAPMPAAPPAPQTAAPPEPKPAPEPEPVDLSQLLPPIPQLPPTPPDIPKPEVELPKPEPDKKKAEKPKPEKKKEKPKKEKPKKEKSKKPKPDPEPVVAQQPAQPAQRQAPAAAPAQPALAPVAPSAAELARRAAAEANWQGILQAHLQKHQKYPRSALRRHVEGSAFIRFRMDRSGQVLSASLVRSSGHEVLDEESLAMLERAQPLPPLPAEVTGDSIQIDIPVVFNLKDAR